MSTIEFSEQDFAAIERAAAAEGIPVDEWVVANLPLNGSRAESHASPPSTGTKPGRTMADLLAGRVGVIRSGGDGRLSEKHSEVFAELLEEQRRAGRL